MAWKPDLESLFNDEAVADSINNSFLQEEKYFAPRPREHIEFALRKIKLIEEKEKEEEKKKNERKEMNEKIKNKEKDDKTENEENEEQDIKKPKDRTFIFKLFDIYTKQFKHHSTALPDVIPEFPDLSLNEDIVVTGKEHNDCLEIEKESIQMMRSLGMYPGRPSYLDVNRTISTQPITSSVIFPASQYGIPILTDEIFFEFSKTAKKENCPETTVSAINFLHSFEFEKRSYENDAFAKAILENKSDNLNDKDAKEQYLKEFPRLENTILKVCDFTHASVPSSSVQALPLFKKNKRKKKLKNKNKISQEPEVDSTKVKKRPTYRKLDIF